MVLVYSSLSFLGYIFMVLVYSGLSFLGCIFISSVDAFFAEKF